MQSALCASLAIALQARAASARSNMLRLEALAVRNMASTQELAAARGESTAAIDKRIAIERVNIMRAEMGRPATPQRAATMEITASRKAPKDQSAKIIYDGKAKAADPKTPTPANPAPAPSATNPPIRRQFVGFFSPTATGTTVTSVGDVGLTVISETMSA